ncbi:hypothetical protein EGW08_009856, partial [Elysia chlorotica]
AYLEAGGAPVHELDGPLGLDGGDGGVDVLGDYVTAVQQAAGHVLAVSRVALHHLVGRLEARVRDLLHSVLLVVSLRSQCKGYRVGRQREMDSWVRHQVGLELGEIHIQRAIESGRDGGHNLADESVQVGVSRSPNVKVAPADVVDGLVVHHEGAVRVLQGRVGRQDRVVRLHHGRGDLR